MPDTLLDLVETYFHEDYDDFYVSGIGVARHIRSVYDASSLVAAVQEIGEILSSDRSDAELQELWIDDLGSYYEPDQDGMTYRQWFERLRQILTSPLPPETDADAE